MNKNILATILIVLLITIAVFYFMANGVEAPSETDDMPVEQPALETPDQVTEPEQPEESEPAPAETGNNAFIGMTTTEARAYAEANNIMFRIGAIDGEFLALTMDYRPGRVTASVVDDIIVEYSVEGSLE